MTSEPEPTRNILQRALSALQRGDRVTARRLAWEATAQIPDSETPWLILAALSSPEESLEYINKALNINPESVPAQKALQWAQKKLEVQAPEVEPEKPPEQAAPVVSPPKPEQVPARTPTPSKPVARKKKFALSKNLITALSVLVLVIIILVAGIYLLLPRIPDLLGGIGGGKGDCVASLNLGNRSLEILTLAAKSDGTFRTPRALADTVYWVKGTDTNLVFILAPTAENLTLISSIKEGDIAALTWPDCNISTYSMSALSSEQPFNLNQIDQTAVQITIFIPAGSTLNGFMMQGDLLEESITSISTPNPADMQIKMSLMEFYTSPDKNTLTIGVRIQNLGTSGITLAPKDISFAAPNAPNAALVQTDPTLPMRIEPGTSQSVLLTFTRPPGNVATLKVLTAEYQLEGY